MQQQHKPLLSFLHLQLGPWHGAPGQHCCFLTCALSQEEDSEGGRARGGEGTPGREEGLGCQPPEVAQILNEYTTDCER